MPKISATDSFGKVHWLCESGDNWHWNDESHASDLPMRRAEFYLTEIIVRNRHLDAEDRMTPTLVKER